MGVKGGPWTHFLFHIEDTLNLCLELIPQDKIVISCEGCFYTENGKMTKWYYLVRVNVGYGVSLRVTIAIIIDS